jgi:hypothetical protein
MHFSLLAATMLNRKYAWLLQQAQLRLPSHPKCSSFIATKMMNMKLPFMLRYFLQKLVNITAIQKLYVQRWSSSKHKRILLLSNFNQTR